MEREAFGRLVEEVLLSLPARFRRYAENVAITVQDHPRPAQLRRAGVSARDFLLGLYEGVPRVARDGRPAQLPDRIILFQRNLEQVAGSGERLRAEIRRTIVHELGHHLGLPEHSVRAVERRSPT